MIRVCHLASGDLWAGAEAQVAAMCRGLHESGLAEVSAILLNHGRLEDELRSAGVPVGVIDERLHPWWEILRQLLRSFRRRPVDLLHTHRYKENVLGGLAARVRGVRHVIRTVHGTTEIYSGWGRVKAAAYGTLDDLACRRVVGTLVGVSKEITEGLRRRFPARLVVHIPNCIDERQMVLGRSREETRHELGVKEFEFAIGTVGRLVPVKGIEHLIRAAAEMIRRREAVRVVIAGDGPALPELVALVRSLGLEQKVSFLGWRRDALEVINALDLFVLPSLHEGMPTVLLEAMALGVPVVASRAGGIPEILADGRTGLLAEPGSPASLAEKCLDIMASPGLARALAENGRRAAAGYYCRHTIERMLGLYQRLAGHPAAVPPSRADLGTAGPLVRITRDRSVADRSTTQ